MNFEEFVRWLERLVVQGRLTPEQMEDLETQRRRFDDERRMLETEFHGRVVGFCASERVVDETMVGLLNQVLDRYQGRYQVYFEAVAARAIRPEAG